MIVGFGEGKESHVFFEDQDQLLIYTLYIGYNYARSMNLLFFSTNRVLIDAQKASMGQCKEVPDYSARPVLALF